MVALGSDMIEMPKAESSQNTLAFTLDTKIDKDTPVVLKNSSGNDSIHQRVSKRLLLVHLTLKTAVTVCSLHHLQVRITAFLLKQNSMQIIRLQSAVRVYLMLIRL